MIRCCFDFLSDPAAVTFLQRWSHELGVVLLVYLLHGPASARAPIRIFSMLGPQLSELLEGVLQAPRYVGRQHLAGLGSYTFGGVNRPPRDEHERPGRRTDPALADQEEELSLQHVEQLVVTVVNMAGWPIPWGTSRFEDTYRASGLLAG